MCKVTAELVASNVIHGSAVLVLDMDAFGISESDNVEAHTLTLSGDGADCVHTDCSADGVGVDAVSHSIIVYLSKNELLQFDFVLTANRIYNPAFNESDSASIQKCLGEVSAANYLAGENFRLLSNVLAAFFACFRDPKTGPAIKAKIKTGEVTEIAELKEVLDEVLC